MEFLQDAAWGAGFGATPKGSRLSLGEGLALSIVGPVQAKKGDRYTMAGTISYMKKEKGWVETRFGYDSTTRNKIVSGPGSENPPTPTTSALQPEAERYSYAVGTDLGKSLTAVKEYVDMTALVAGIEDALHEKPRITNAERDEIMGAVAKKLQEKQKVERAAISERNKRTGHQYLAENAQKTGVVITKSGLQYQVLRNGTGAAKPNPGSTVTAHYVGQLTDGTEFDNSYKRGNPTEFPLENVIQGWQEGLQLMSIGSQYRFVIPAALGYGDRGAGAKIPPDSVLVFEVELLGIK